MVTSKLESLGYLIVTLVLSLRDHGLKVNRIRVWVLGVLAPFVSEAVRKEAQRQAEIVELYLRQSPLPLSHCLLEESDTDFQYYSKELMAPPNKLSFAEALKGDMKMRRKYPRLHKAFWKKRFKTVAPELPADIDNFYKTTVVTARECALLQYDERVQEQESQDAMDGTEDSALDNVDSYLDSSQGVDRYNRMQDSLPTVTPQGRIIKVKKLKVKRKRTYRHVLGLEKLMCQGIDRALLKNKRYRDFKNRVLSDLAGNAFAGPHVAVATLVTATVLAQHAPRSEEEHERALNHAKQLARRLQSKEKAGKEKGKYCKSKEKAGKSKEKAGKSKEKAGKENGKTCKLKSKERQQQGQVGKSKGKCRKSKEQAGKSQPKAKPKKEKLKAEPKKKKQKAEPKKEKQKVARRLR
jgi:hypothetical protein